ncbi:MAG: hypothetical protein WB988_08530 [Candidatus Nitrosopolaris sp.]
MPLTAMINTITVGAMIAAAILTMPLAYANVHTATYWKGYKEGKFVGMLIL